MGLNDTWDRYRAGKWIVGALGTTKGKDGGIHRMALFNIETGNSAN
jgi:hypothetical protein